MVQLHHHRQTFERSRARVLVISFGRENSARRWLQETGAGFPLLLDPERRVYRAYQLERSASRAWSPRNLWSYAVAFFRGRKLHGIQGDPAQLGGDFLVAPDGKIRMVYYSHDPTYRPQVAQILQALRDGQPSQT